MADTWPKVTFADYGLGSDAVSSGSSVALHAEVDLAGLTPDDVRVEALVGRVGADGELEDVQVLVLEPTGQHGDGFLFGREIVPYATGRLGFAVRVTPNHFDDPLNRPCNALLKWAGIRPGE